MRKVFPVLMMVFSVLTTYWFLQVWGSGPWGPAAAVHSTVPIVHPKGPSEAHEKAPRTVGVLGALGVTLRQCAEATEPSSVMRPQGVRTWFVTVQPSSSNWWTRLLTMSSSQRMAALLSPRS